MKKVILIWGALLVSAWVCAQSLEDYYLVAVENNPALLATYKKFEASMERISQVNSLPDPTLSMGIFISPIETRVGPQRVKFSLTQMFPWFGTLKAKGNLATVQAEAQFQSFLEQKNALYYQVAKAYYPLHELKKLKEVEEENIKILESYKLIVESQIKNGQSSAADALRLNLRLTDSQTMLEILEKKERSLKVSFNNLLNRETNSEIEIGHSWEIRQVEESYRQDSLLARNPMLKKLDLQIKASEIAGSVVRLNSLPKIGLGVDYAIIGERTDMQTPPEGNGRDAIMPMVSISLPIFRKQYHSAIREEELKREGYNLQKTAYSNSLWSEYETIMYELERQSDLINLYQSQTEEINEILELMMTVYGNSGIEFWEILEIQQELLKYKKSRITAETQFLVKKAQLDYITSKSY